MCVVALASGQVPLSRSAESTAFRAIGIEPIVSPDAFRRFTVDLQLGDAEREAANLLLDDYASEMRQLLEDTRGRQEADRAQLDAALDGRIRLDAAALRQVRVSLRTIVADACRTADIRLDEMVEWATLLSPADAQAKAAATGNFYRTICLPEGNRDGLVDVEALASRAIGDELDASSLSAALSEYGDALAVIARTDSQHVRDSRIQDDLAALQGNSPERVTIQRDGAARWVSRMQLQDAAVQAVAAMLSPDAAAGWRMAADAALFPSICRPADAARAAAWVSDHADASVAETAAECVAAASDRLSTLRAEAVEILREGRAAGVDLDHEAAALVADATPLRMRYLRNSGERSVLEEDMLDCVLQPLTDGQRAAVRRVLLMGR
jgi:hypothetical protein